VALQRDTFIAEIVRRLPHDPSIMFLSADFGAEALDELRDKHPAHFLHCGIAEQAMIDVATGLALEGRTVFVYAMAPFLSLRALEQIKCGPGLMDLPICLLSIGVGLGYADAGPTHYATEDFACLRAVVGARVYTTADGDSAAALARHLLATPAFAYVRLDRHDLPTLGPTVTDEIIREGYRVFGEVTPSKLALVSHGRMAHTCVALAAEDPDRFFAVDLLRAKPFPAGLARTLATAAGTVVVDEQTPSGSLPAAVFEGCAAQGAFPHIVPVTLPEQYVFQNGGRVALLETLGLSRAGIISAIHGANLGRPVVPE
jgi:transketolase